MDNKVKNTDTSEFGSEFGAESRKHFDATVARLLEAIGGSDIGSLASFLGISRQAINKARATNKIPPAWFIHIGRVVKVSIDWLVTGDGPKNRDESAPATAPAPAQPEPPPSEDDFKMSDMLTKTAEVLESETIYRTALASNINAFHQAVRSERTLVRIEERMGLLEQRMEELANENVYLKQRLERQDENNAKAVGADG